MKIKVGISITAVEIQLPDCDSPCPEKATPCFCAKSDTFFTTESFCNIVVLNLVAPTGLLEFLKKSNLVPPRLSKA